MAIDFRVVLKKYLRQVRDEEGWSCLDERYPSTAFTEEEWRELLKCDEEDRAEEATETKVAHETELVRDGRPAVAAEAYRAIQGEWDILLAKYKDKP